MSFIRPISLGNQLFVEMISDKIPYNLYRTINLDEKKFNKFYVLKSIHPNFTNEEFPNVKLKNESDILSVLHHPNIPAFVKSGEFHGQPFFTYNYVWGKSLLEILRVLKQHNKLLSESYASYIMLNVCDALFHSHSYRDNKFRKGILHRNLNPNNIIISYTGEVYLVGYGMAPFSGIKDFDDLDFRQLVYFSPEQILQKPLNSKSEIFSLGSIFYEIITGTPPFLEKTQSKVINRISKCSYLGCSQINPYIPRYIENIIDKSLSLYPNDRFSSMQEISDGLSDFLLSKHPNFKREKMGKLMKQLFHSEIIEEIKYFKNLFSKIKNPKRNLLRSIPKSLFDSLNTNVEDNSKIFSVSLSFTSPSDPAIFENDIENVKSMKTLQDTMLYGDYTGKKRVINKRKPTDDFIDNNDTLLMGSEMNFINKNLSDSKNDSVDLYEEHNPQVINNIEEKNNNSQTSTLKSKELEKSQLLVGKELGEYRITGVIGWGGMGTVYEGIQPDINKKVAVKVLRPKYNTKKEIISRFLAEAKAVNAINHPNIIDIFAFGIYEKKFRYFVMEKLEGRLLTDFMREETEITYALIHDIWEQILSAIGSAHEKGIIHRDIKPDNIFLVNQVYNNNFVKILDFGIAKFAEDGFRTGVTKTGIPIGTPLYMSPEQCQGLSVSPASDIYSLGVLLYQMFTGRVPFEKDSYLSMLQAHLLETPPPPSEFGNVDDVLEALILRCLSKHPKDRPQSTKDLSDELLPIIRSQYSKVIKWS